MLNWQSLEKQTLKILTEPPGILAPSVTGLGVPVQAIEVEISETGSSGGRIVIVHAHFPQLPASVCDEIAHNLRAHFQGGDLYFTIINTEGEAEVYAPVDQHRLDAFLVAAAVAIIKASWGWEEINPMLITIAGEPVKVQLEVEDQLWIAIMAQRCLTKGSTGAREAKFVYYNQRRSRPR